MPAMTARMRWLLGGGIAAVAVVAVVAAALVLSARPVPEALKYIPANSAVVAELRLDLPGDQFQKVGNLLAHFPGFADQSSLGAKLDETLDRLSGDASSGKVTYTANLKPWLVGPTFVGVLPTSGPSAAPSPAASRAASDRFGGTGDGVVVATTDGKVTCDAAIPDGQKQGDLLVSADGRMACQMDGKFGLLGTPAGIQAALAAHRGASGIDHDATYGKARDTLGGDRLATVYVSGAAAQAMAAAEASLAPLPSGFPAGLPSTSQLASVLPEWLIAGIRAEDDALVTDLIVAPAKASSGASPATGTPGPSLPTLPPPHTSSIAGSLPGNTLLLAETHGVGVAAQAALAALRNDPDFQAQASQLDAALTLAGGPQGIVGWIDDAGVVIVPSPGSTIPGASPAPGGSPSAGDLGLDAGIVLVATDEATASAKVAQLTNLLSVVALGSGGSVTPANVDGTTITTIDLGDLSSLLSQAGGSGAISGLPIPTDLHVKFSLAVRGKLVLLGGDEAFARDVLGVQAGSTLADQDAYKRALGHASASNLAQLYVAGGSLRSLVDRFVPADQQARWQQDLRPYAAPIDGLVVTTTLENGLSHTRIVLSVSTSASTPASSSNPAQS